MSAWAALPHPSAEREEARRGVEAMGVKGIEAIGVLKTECQDNWVSPVSEIRLDFFTAYFGCLNHALSDLSSLQGIV